MRMDVFEPKEILVIEDDQSWQEIYTEILESEGKGYRITLADNRNDAITKLSERQYVAVIIDLSVPVSSEDTTPKFENGLAILSHLSKLGSRPSILVNTGHSQLPLDIANTLNQLGIGVLAKKTDELDDFLTKIRREMLTKPTDIIMKFGGTSMGTRESINKVVNIIISHVKKTSTPVSIVVSAMSGVTNRLLSIARSAEAGELPLVHENVNQIRSKHWSVANQLLRDTTLQQEYSTFLDKIIDELQHICSGVVALEELNSRALDRILGYGERLAAYLLAAVLSDRGIKSVAVDATKLIVSDDVFGSASPLMEESKGRIEKELVPLLKDGIVPVAMGFVASTISGVPTTIGRGGSDFSATILGYVLDAKEVWIWTDVAGVMNADPNLVRNARVISQMSYERAVELTFHGAKVLHPKALLTAMQKNVSIRILNTFAPDEMGTLISADQMNQDQDDVLVSTIGLTLVSVNCSLLRIWTPNIGARVLSSLARHDIEIMGYYQSFSQQTLFVILREMDLNRAVNTLGREFRSENHVQSITARGNMASISVIGSYRTDPELAGRLLKALDTSGLDVLGVLKLPHEKSFSILLDENMLSEAVGVVSPLVIGT